MHLGGLEDPYGASFSALSAGSLSPIRHKRLEATQIVTGRSPHGDNWRVYDQIISFLWMPS
jgi:hypothetical protein